MIFYTVDLVRMSGDRSSITSRAKFTLDNFRQDVKELHKLMMTNRNESSPSEWKELLIYVSDETGQNYSLYAIIDKDGYNPVKTESASV